jgi:hypothetical protein
MGGQKNRDIPGIFDQYDIYENCRKCKQENLHNLANNK